MKNMKTEPSEKTIIYRTPGDPIEITDEMLENAEINPNELVDIILQKGCIIIKPTSVLGRLPEDLLLLYEELGFSREMVECVFTKYAEESRLPRALLNPGKEKTRQNGRRIKEENEEMFTLTASDIHGILLDSRIRRLTPLETFRLQGVPDAYFERAASVCSDAQLYKQIGNAVTVPVVRAIGEKIAEYWKGEKI